MDYFDNIICNKSLKIKKYTFGGHHYSWQLGSRYSLSPCLHFGCSFLLHTNKKLGTKSTPFRTIQTLFTKYFYNICNENILSITLKKKLFNKYFEKNSHCPQQNFKKKSREQIEMGRNGEHQDDIHRQVSKPQSELTPTCIAYLCNFL